MGPLETPHDSVDEYLHLGTGSMIRLLTTLNNETVSRSQTLLPPALAPHRFVASNVTSQPSTSE